MTPAMLVMMELLLTKGPTFVMELQDLFGGNRFNEQDLEDLRKGVKAPEDYFK